MLDLRGPLGGCAVLMGAVMAALQSCIASAVLMSCAGWQGSCELA